MAEIIEDPILTLLSKNNRLMVFKAIQEQVPLSERRLKRRLNQLVREGKIQRYRSLKDARRFCYRIPLE